MQLPLVVKEKQNRPTINEAEISAMLATLKGHDAVVVALVARTGLRIGEALASRTDDFDPLCRVLQVQRSVWRRREQAPKTLNAIRPVDIPESLAQVLCRYIKGRKGHLFTTRAGRLLDSRNVLDVLQRAGRQGGYHAFRRFRFAVLSAFVVLGLGMAVSVAPLTTVVMSSVDQMRAGAASGINNAVSRVAGVLAVAILGIVMVSSFSHRLQRSLDSLDLAPGVLHQIQSSEIRLAGLDAPSDLDAQGSSALRAAISKAFVFGFRLIMLLCAGLAVASATVAYRMLPSRAAT